MHLISIRFSKNSEANVSEFYENLEEVSPWYWECSVSQEGSCKYFSVGGSTYTTRISYWWPIDYYQQSKTFLQGFQEILWISGKSRRIVSSILPTDGPTYWSL